MFWLDHDLLDPWHKALVTRQVFCSECPSLDPSPAGKTLLLWVTLLSISGRPDAALILGTSAFQVILTVGHFHGFQSKTVLTPDSCKANSDTEHQARAKVLNTPSCFLVLGTYQKEMTVRKETNNIFKFFLPPPSAWPGIESTVPNPSHVHCQNWLLNPIYFGDSSCTAYPHVSYNQSWFANTWFKCDLLQDSSVNLKNSYSL